MGKTEFSRRQFLTRSALIGCSLAASPMVTPVLYASAPWEGRLVVIILRGGMDGLDALRPVGDPDYARLGRGALGPGAKAGEGDLTGFFSLHPAMNSLRPLWQAGELAFSHAVATPYREKRSHFDGQDLLESGMLSPDGARDGWLNRVLAAAPAAETETGFAIGNGDMLLMRGDAPVANWAPDTRLPLSPQAVRLVELVMHRDPLFRDTAVEAMELAQILDPDGAEDSAEMAREMRRAMLGTSRGENVTALAEFTANRLRADTRLAAFSLNGFDTHSRQRRGLNNALKRLATAITVMKDNLGEVWGRTTVVAMTEFGRTARLNGTGGTDHGTGGLMVMAGGALRGGRVVGQWPGLAEADLYQRRDLMPTADLRAHTGWLLRDMFGLDRRFLEQTVFPGMELGENPQLIL